MIKESILLSNFQDQYIALVKYVSDATNLKLLKKFLTKFLEH